MTQQQEKRITLKQWQRRALAAEEELAMQRRFRSLDSQREMEMSRELAMLRVAMAEIREVQQWLQEGIAP